MSEDIYANILSLEGTNALKALGDRKLSLLGLVLAWSTSQGCGPGGSVDVCLVPGQAAEDTTSTTMVLTSVVVVSSLGTERPVGVLLEA